MKICWENLEGFYLSDGGYLKRNGILYVEREKCKFCGNPFLTSKTKPSRFCSNICSKIKDITGQQFNRLTVLGFLGQNTNGKSVWRCRCECGNHINLSGASLNSGNTQSCGCLNREITSKLHSIDETGNKYGELVVLKRVGTNYGQTVWECKCSCGNTVTAKGSGLRRGTTRSCYNCSLSDITGNKYGKWTVLERSYTNKYGHQMYKCRCSCGKIGIVNSVNLKRGTSQSCGCVHHLRGEKAMHYNPKLTDEDRMNRRCFPGYKDWVKIVYKTDSYTCQCCGEKRKINAHHIESYNNNRSLRVDASNGITLCEDCHMGFHQQYGRGSNDRAQLINFLKAKKYEY